jgi:hypothetical protein
VTERPPVFLVMKYASAVGSLRQPDALFVYAQKGLMARNGIVVEARSAARRFLIALVVRAPGWISYDTLIDLLFGDDPDGGPLYADAKLRALCSEAARYRRGARFQDRMRDGRLSRMADRARRKTTRGAFIYGRCLSGGRMKDAPTKAERRFLEVALATYRTHQAEPVCEEPKDARPQRKGVGAEIRRLYFDHVDDRAIAAMLGVSIGQVTSTIARARRRFDLGGHRRNTAVAGILIDLPDDLRGALMAEAARLKVGVNSFANSLLSEALRAGLTPSAATLTSTGGENDKMV